MKGLNVKRIAALAVGAAILGATLAYAGAVTYSNTQIITADGTPNVKVVVGANAAASDGVAAANIAALIGNLAFTSQQVTATVGGTAGLGCTVTGAGGTGTCAVSNQQVTLDVTVPGTVGGVAPFNTYINDWVDKKLENRMYSTSDDVYNSSVDESPFYSGAVGSGYVADYGQPNYGQWSAFRKFTSADFPALQSPTVSDPYANVQYTEAQTLWFQAWAKYDSSSTINALVAANPKGAYQIEFTQNQGGIPVGTCDATSYQNLDPTLNTTANDEANYNLCSPNDLTDRHRVSIGFLGDTYIISAMNPPGTCTLTSATSECTGGSINLAKESAYGIVHVGENLTAGAYTVKLEDIEAPLGAGHESEASIGIFDSTGALLKEDKINPSATGTAYSWTAPDGSKVKIKVYKTNPGYYAYAKWAEMAIYSQEFTMSDGSQLNSDNNNWDVKLVWRNQNPTYTFKGADSLRKIILEDASSPNELTSGATYNFIQTPVAFQVEFGGITLGTGDYDQLSLQLETNTQHPVQTNYSALCSTGGATTGYLYGNFIKVSSQVPGAFQLNGPSSDTEQVQYFWYYTGNSSAKSSNTSIANDSDIIFYKPSQSCLFTMPGGSSAVQYMAGDATSDDWNFAYTAHAAYSGSGTCTTSPTTCEGMVTITEAASSTAGIADSWIIPVYIDPTNEIDEFLLGTAATAQISYQGVTTANNGIDTHSSPNMRISTANAPVGYYSERGSYVNQVSSSGVSIERARKLGELKFFVKSQGANTTSATKVGPLGINQSANVGGGVTITVDSITSTVGTCTAGPNAVCTVTGQNGLTATPSVTAANVRVPLNPVTSALVVLDSGADTTANLIVVGGPQVNTVASTIMTNTPALTLAKPGDMIAQAVGNNRILVAGYTGADTTAAANKFMTDLMANVH